MPMLYILCGLPFSGKSLLSKEIEKTTSIKRISFDDMWDLLKKFNKDISYEIGLNKIEKELTKNLRAGNSIVYDSINLSEKHRNRLKKLAENAGAHAKVVYLQAFIEEIHKRQKQSLIDNSHLNVLSEEDINADVKRFEIPDDCILVSTEQGKINFLNDLKLEYPIVSKE